ncbi:amidohydrolase family protein [Paraburkholderia megapolitana]|uniref:Predicted metal-dependent hydrolase, TIM-barrel fold n=1 Tax=Paraburkholderia megapolitana TaxID=420953 RepID=A0A1I3DCZ3_9BURK|nr:amidohydrolase family protein [Paraburkholderia megapolitana]QDQ81775.1 amidohydrolase family protein [Paraburkholderia megapolitana]SFH84341.1 Predicted metal-dependent hydrolase, TIM-barrel fold [Paraburkholderia megapolitana]
MVSRRSFNGALAGLAASQILAGCASTTGGEARRITGIDTHAHVFLKNLPLVAGHRYSISYDAPLERYLALLDAHRMSNGVLIQPSFLGTDNTYLLAALKQYPQRLRGIVVLDPATDVERIAEWSQAGARGIRLNLIDHPDPDFSTQTWRTLFPRLREEGWQIELHAEARRLPALLPPLLAEGIDISIDHFGRPDPKLGAADPGFRYLLTTAGSGRVWVKISGAYRNDAPGRWQATGLQLIQPLRETFGPRRLLWGSDWPHVGYESSINYDVAYAYMEQLLPDAEERRQVLVDTPAALFRF